MKRSFVVIVRWLGLSCVLSYSYNELKQSAVEKSVMFEEGTISVNADFSKDRKSIYRHNKLSKEDKKLLYENRPDLNPKQPLIQEQAFEHDGSQLEQPLLPNINSGSSDVSGHDVVSALHVLNSRGEAACLEGTASPEISDDFSSRSLAHLKLISLQQQISPSRATASSEVKNEWNQMSLQSEGNDLHDSSSSSEDEADEEDLALSE